MSKNIKFKEIPEIGVSPYSNFEDSVKYNLKVINREMAKDLEILNETTVSFNVLSRSINGSGHTIDIEHLKKIYAISQQLETLEGAFFLMQRNLDTFKGIFTGETKIEVKK